MWETSIYRVLETMQVDKITQEIKEYEKSRPTLLQRFKSQREEVEPARRLRESRLGGKRRNGVWWYAYVKGQKKCFQTGVANCIECC